MKAVTPVIFLLCTSIINGGAQKAPIKFGEIPKEQLEMKIYDKDSSAAAVVLCDYGEAHLAFVGMMPKLVFDRHTRIKILNKNGLRWANAGVFLFKTLNAEETLSNLKAASYNLEHGAVIETKMSKEGIFKENFNRNYNLQKFTVPNVKEGSVIEYSYRINSDFIINFPNWQFQWTIPTIHSEYWALFPDVFHFEQYMQGYLPITSYEVVEKNQGEALTYAHHWILRDAPAFREEPYMTTDQDYVAKMNFALSYIQFSTGRVQEIMSSWEKISEGMLRSDYFGSAVKGSPFLKPKVEELTSGLADPLEKVSVIHAFVKQNIEWDGYKDMMGYNLKKVWDDKKGSSGEINLILASMLQKAGLNVDLILLSTRDHGFVRKNIPMLKQFNYVVCTVRLPGKIIMLDATEKYLPINVLPERCINGEGLIVSETSTGWMSLETRVKAKTSMVADLSIEANGEMTGTLSITHDGYDAYRMRKNYLGKGAETYMKEFLAAKQWEVEKTDFQQVEDFEKAAKQSHQLTIKDHAIVAGDVIYLNPFVAEQIITNPFVSETREYPVDFGPAIEKVYMCKIKIPQGYNVDELPSSRVFVLPGNAAKYSYNVVQTGDVINIISNLQIGRTIFQQQEYPDLREFYTQVVGKQAEQIVFKKKR